MSRVVRYEPCPKCRANGYDSTGDNLVVYDDGGYHCFRCGYHKGAVRYAHQEPLNVPKAVLPFDFSREVPTDAWKWLLQYGLPYSYWQERVGFSPSESRLVFLVGQPVQFSIGRLIGEPKGENHAKRRKWYVWGDSHKHAEIIGTGDSVVLVEDLVSAHKVGQVTTAIPLFGVEIHKPILYFLMYDTRPVKIWLDKDQESSVKKKATNLQALLNRKVDVIVTDKDPKCYSLNEIKEIIK